MNSHLGMIRGSSTSTPNARPEPVNGGGPTVVVQRRRKFSDRYIAAVATVLVATIPIIFVGNRLLRNRGRSNNNNVPPRKSLLDVYSTSHLPPCSANRVSLNSVSPLTPPDENKPTLYSDWNINDDFSDMDKFIEKYGQYAQYVKMGDALPLFDAKGKKCAVSTRALLGAFVDRFGNNNNKAKDNVDVDQQRVRRMRIY